MSAYVFLAVASFFVGFTLACIEGWFTRWIEAYERRTAAIEREQTRSGR